jgi:hypothetical protein
MTAIDPDGPDDDAWFVPKRFGYGAGLPIRWQGWAVLGGYLAALWAISLLHSQPGALPRTAATVLLLSATALLIWISARKTRGGFRWRWGDKD